MNDAPVPPTPDAEQQALLEAMRAVLGPLARLAIARGMSFATLEELVKQAMVRAALDAHGEAGERRAVSRVSTATGIHRRDVARLLGRPDDAPPERGRPPVPVEVFTRWLAEPAYRDETGSPRALARLGPAPSFESLAQSVTRDVHPRSVLDELLRLGLATLDEASDTVAPRREGFVPRGDRVRMLGFLADNVGDHLDASVHNLLADGPAHFEQAIYADGLSQASLQTVRALVSAQWKSMLEQLVPQLRERVRADAALPPGERRRVRVGLYGYDAPALRDAAATPDAAAMPRVPDPERPAPPRRRPRRS